MTNSAWDRALSRAAAAARPEQESRIRIRQQPLHVKNVAVSDGPKRREEYLAAEVPLPSAVLLRPGDIIRLKSRKGVVVVIDVSRPHGHYLQYTTFVDRSRTRVSQTVRMYYVPDQERFLIEGQTDVDLPVPSDEPGTNPQTRNTNRPKGQKKEAIKMATVVKRSGKKGSTTKASTTKSTTTKAASGGAKSNGRTPKRSAAEIAKLVPAFRRHLQGGGTMRDLKKEHGFSDDGPIRAALYRAGFDSKGAEHGETANSIDASKAAGKKRVLALRSEGAGWYRLAFLTGLGESEVKAIVSEAGGPTGRVYTQSEKPAKSAAKSSGKKVTRRATKADPSNKG